MKKTSRSLPVIQPKPFRTLDRDNDDPGEVRRDDCRYYDRCNHIAIVAGWPGFTCAGCTGHVEKSPEARERDAYASIRAAAELLGFRTDAPPANDAEETVSIASIKWAA